MSIKSNVHAPIKKTKEPPLVSYKDIDPRLKDVRTGDIAITTRDDLSGILITYFTFSLYQHVAIFAWVDREIYEKTKNVVFKSHCDENSSNGKGDLLTFCHITKKRMFDMYTGNIRNGLVLCSLDEYCKKNLITIWNRPLSKNITDDSSLSCFKHYFSENHLILEYENDLRCIFGVPANIVFHPYEHRVICTAMVCNYLESSYGYPFLISEKGIPFESESIDNSPREIDFHITKRDFNVYRALDFVFAKNTSPVLSDEEEKILYGRESSAAFSTFHPFSLICVGIMMIIAVAIILYFTLVKFTK